MVQTLRYQAEQRATDLLWRPEQVARRVTQHRQRRSRPPPCWSTTSRSRATIGLRALRVPYGDVVLGHPTALPVGDELYGVPSAWPPAIGPGAVDLAQLRATARRATTAFTETYNQTLHVDRARQRPPVDDAFAAHGELVLYNYPAELHGPIRTAQLPRHAFLGQRGPDGDRRPGHDGLARETRPATVGGRLARHVPVGPCRCLGPHRRSPSACGRTRRDGHRPDRSCCARRAPAATGSSDPACRR